MAKPKISKAAIRRRLMKKKRRAGAANQGHDSKGDMVRGNPKKGYPGLRSS